MKTKGFYPMYTILGLFLVLVVVAVSLQFNNQSSQDYSSHIDRIAWLRINHDVDNVRTMASDSLKDLFQEAVMDVGRIGNGSVNRYLTHSREEGWEMLVDDVRKRVSDGFEGVISGLADYSDGHNNVFAFEEGINITVGSISADDLDVRSGGNGVAAIVRLPMEVSSRYHGWEALLMDGNITIPLDIRLRDMYDRAWDFNRNYKDIATWTFTAAIYARAYAAAYNSDSEGAFLKEANYDFDPAATLLFGDLDTVKEFSKDPGSLLDIGAIPAATWLAEWFYLSEPSFLPAGFDLGAGDREGVKNAMLNNYNMQDFEESVCSGLPSGERDGCRSVYDTEELEKQVDEIRDRRDMYGDLRDGLEDWFRYYDTTDYLSCKSCKEERDDCEQRCKIKPRNKRRRCYKRCDRRYDSCREREETRGNHKLECQKKELNRLRINKQTCDEFREVANRLLSDITSDFGEINGVACQEQLDTAVDTYDPYGLDVDGDVRAQFKRNNETYGFEEVEEYCDFPEYVIENVKEINEDKLTERKIADRYCLRPEEVRDCEEDHDCEDGGDCDVHCHYPRCPSSGESYDCLGDKDLWYYRTEECTVCETSSSGREYCDDETDRIDQCTCRCRASIGLLIEINKYLLDIREYVDKTYTALDKTYEAMKKQLDNREAIEDLKDNVDTMEANELGYDVFSRIDTGVVEYDKGEFVGGKECYYDPTFDDRDNGSCGDSVESVGLYTVQIAAAALASVLSMGAGTPLLDYAKDFFPVIYETGVSYNLTETLIDDGNRAVLTNLAGDGGELYTYAPFEFEIYKDREFDIGSATLDRIVVYIYLPALEKENPLGGLQKVMDGLQHESCTGISCG